MLSAQTLTEQKKKQELQKKISWGDQRKLNEEKSALKKIQSKKISLADLTLFTQQLAAMLKAELPLVSAIDAFWEKIETPFFKVLLKVIRDDIVKGVSLSDAMKKFPNAFPLMFISMIEAGEASGSLAEVMENMAGYFDNTLKLTKKIKSAITYPAVVLSLSFLLVFGIIIFIIPIFSEMFTSFGSQLPLPTRILIYISNFFTNLKNMIFVLCGSIALFWGLRNFLKTQNGKYLRDLIIKSLPIFGDISVKTNASRFCRTYSVLLTSGVPILRTIEICSNLTDNVYLVDSCKKIADGIRAGKQLSDILENSIYFPPLVLQMVKAGEKAGNIEKMVLNASDLFDTDVNNLVFSLTSLIEPLLICFMGLILGGIVIALFLPIFQLSSVVGGA